MRVSLWVMQQRHEKLNAITDMSNILEAENKQDEITPNIESQNQAQNKSRQRRNMPNRAV